MPRLPFFFPIPKFWQSSTRSFFTSVWKIGYPKRWQRYRIENVPSTSRTYEIFSFIKMTNKFVLGTFQYDYSKFSTVVVLLSAFFRDPLHLKNLSSIRILRIKHPSFSLYLIGSWVQVLCILFKQFYILISDLLSLSYVLKV